MTSANTTSPDLTDEEQDSSPTIGTSVTAIIICNSVSILVCFVTLTLYGTLFLKAKYKKLMRRTSLALAACMATSDFVLHCSNLAGYGSLPPGFGCAFVGGWLFAAPTLLSIFYSCCIALNSQIAFVFRRRPPGRSLAYFIVAPILIDFAITFAALGAGVYGYDETWGYCWYSTRGISSEIVLFRIIFTYSLPAFLCVLYLIVATVTISIAVFGSSSLAGITRSIDLSRRSANLSPVPTSSCSPTRGREAKTMQATHSPTPIVYPIPPTSPGTNTSIDSHTFPLSSPTFARLDEKRPSEPAMAFAPTRHTSNEEQPHTSVRVEGPSKRTLRRNLVMRQLTIRLIGYIVTPIICLLPGIILDLITKIFPDLKVPIGLNGLLDGLNGLVGLFNSLLMLSDPALLAVWADMRGSVSKTGNDLTHRMLRAMAVPISSIRPSEDTEQGAEETTRPKRSKHRRHRSADEDALGSTFGIGARTRNDHLEENSSSHLEHELPREVDREEPELGPGDTRRARTRPSEPREEGDLEVFVRVDVTRRISRVQLMEDWLSGL